MQKAVINIQENSDDRTHTTKGKERKKKKGRKYINQKKRRKKRRETRERWERLVRFDDTTEEKACTVLLLPARNPRKSKPQKVGTQKGMNESDTAEKHKARFCLRRARENVLPSQNQRHFVCVLRARMIHEWKSKKVFCPGRKEKKRGVSMSKPGGYRLTSVGAWWW
jgi:hypothetical protein